MSLCAAYRCHVCACSCTDAPTHVQSLEEDSQCPALNPPTLFPRDSLSLHPELHCWWASLSDTATAISDSHNAEVLREKLI